MTVDADAAIREAIGAYGRMDFQLAARTCGSVLESEPDNIDALFLFGLCLGRLGNSGSGLEAVRRAMTLQPCLAHFDILRDLMMRQGECGELQLAEARFMQYRRFRSVDAFLVSYPKCGRTWLRLLLGLYVLGPNGRGDPLEVLQLTSANPDFATLEITHDDYPHWKPADMAFADKRAYADKKVVFLARDPRDVMVSYYFQYTRRDDRKLANDAGFDGSVSDFVRHRIGGLASLVAFYNAWAASRHVPAGFKLVSYEEISADPARVVAEVAAFLGWPARDAGFVNEIVKVSSFANMRRLEETNAFDNPRLRPPDDGDPESFKVRRGRVGGYTDYLSPGDIRYIDQYLATNLDACFARYLSKD